MKIKNNKAQVFSVYLALLALAMCSVVVWMYYSQNKDIESSLISPISLMNLPDRYEIYEFQERKLSKLVVDEIGWDSNEQLFKEKFCEYFIDDGWKTMPEFLLSDLVLDGVEINVLAYDSLEEKKEWCEKLYSFDFENDNLVIERSGVVKSFRVDPVNPTKNTFHARIEYDLSDSYEYTKSEIINTAYTWS